MESRWVGESIDDDTESNVDELFDSLGLSGEVAPSDGEAEIVDPEPERSSLPSRSALLAAGLALALLALAGLAFWLARSPSESTEAALEPTPAADEDAGAADVEDEAEKLRRILGGLSLSEVAVEVRDAKIHLTGSVPTDGDLTTIRNAVITASDPALVDMNDIVVGGPAYGNQPPPAAQPAAPGQQPAAPGQPGQVNRQPPPPPPPGAPPPGFVPPTAEQRANLQRELDRVLTDTPLVFDPDSTDLNELQLKVLDTIVIGLLESHPGVPVRLVGYTDQQGDEYENSLLSFARAEAVRDYLISRGVPEFILRVEGRGEDDASGDRGADRRVEIEVIEGP